MGGQANVAHMATYIIVGKGFRLEVLAKVSVTRYSPVGQLSNSGVLAKADYSYCSPRSLASTRYHEHQRQISLEPWPTASFCAWHGFAFRSGAPALRYGDGCGYRCGGPYSCAPGRALVLGYIGTLGLR